MTVTRSRLRDDLTVAVSGQGGDGSLTVITLLGRILGDRGYHMYSARSVASRIKGGHAAAMVRGSVAERGGLNDAIDVLVAFDDEAVEKLGPQMADDGIVVFDASGGVIPDGAVPPGCTVYAVPFARMAVRDLRRDLYKNSLSFGVLTRVLSVPDDEAEAHLAAGFARLPEALRKANLAALHNGFAYADEQGMPDGRGPLALARVAAPERLMITGNEALSLGFALAGGRFFTGYPITPASEILEWLEANLPAVGGVAVQAEDELAAVNMAIGAALTGVRAMTATSGPGIALMLEGISHAGSAEVPLVIVDCQRSGPSTGMPTKPEQSDIGMLVHGGNGEFPRIVLSPGDPADCFRLGAEAVALSRRLQCPVFVALDQALSQHAATVEPFDLGSVTIEPGAVLDEAALAAVAEYRRYAITPDGVSPWVVPGTPDGMNLVTGNERNEWGQVSIEPANRAAMVAKRARKIVHARDTLPSGRRWGDPEAAIGLLGVGLELAPMLEATERLAAHGVAVAGLQPRTLWPVLPETLEFVAERRVAFVVEHNDEGQIAGLLAGAGADAGAIHGIRRTDGLVFTPGEIVEHVLAVVGA